MSICVLSDDWDGPYVQIDGHAEVFDMPEAVDGLVDYYHCIAGEHPDWQDYRAAMARRDKSLIRTGNSASARGCGRGPRNSSRGSRSGIAPIS